MKKIILGSAVFLFTASSFAKSGCEDFTYNGVFPTTRDKVTILCKNGFAVGYSTEKKTLLWVVERIDPNAKYTIKHRPSFHKDDALPHDVQSSNQDFVGTGYDKGHMVPFEDMSYSRESAYDSMSLTNIVPQNFANNRGGWKSLEMYARKSASYGVVYVVSGPIFEGKMDYLNKRVPIPTSLFKVIINPKTKKTEAWVLPNTPISSYEVDHFKTTPQAIGKLGVQITTP
jgi:endonuclease G